MTYTNHFTGAPQTTRRFLDGRRYRLACATRPGRSADGMSLVSRQADFNCYNAIDRHVLATARGSQVALIRDSAMGGLKWALHTYSQLQAERSRRVAGTPRRVSQRVTGRIYMPMVPGGIRDACLAGCGPLGDYRRRHCATNCSPD